MTNAPKWYRNMSPEDRRDLEDAEDKCCGLFAGYPEPKEDAMTSQEIANKLRLLLEGDDGSEPAPIRSWPEIVEACRVRGIYVCVMPGRNGYHVVIYDLCDESVFSRAEVDPSDLQDAVGLAAIEALEAIK